MHALCKLLVLGVAVNVLKTCHPPINIHEQFEFLIQSNGPVLYQFTVTTTSQNKALGSSSPNVHTQFYTNLPMLSLFDNYFLFRLINLFQEIEKSIWICRHFSILGRPKLLEFSPGEVPAWMSNGLSGKVWDEITYPFLNFNSASLGMDK